MHDIDHLRLTMTGAIMRVARQWRRVSHRAVSGFGVSDACAMPLLSIARLGEGVRQVALAEHIGIEGPSLVRLLDRLAITGLVRREDDPVDGRANRIWLTDTGRDVCARIEAALSALRTQRLKHISAQDIAVTLRVLNAIEHAISADQRRGH
jgi:MarR family transcriptional regulator, transcriptional regulator for hemolysin